jgi:E3 ubiquitin-protein ligase HUWE1
MSLFIIRQTRLRQRVQAAAMQEAQTLADVNPEVLAALPPNIQEEVLAQQRMEQQRQAAANSNPNDPVNAAEFFQNLQPSLRQAVSFHLRQNLKFKNFSDN